MDTASNTPILGIGDARIDPQLHVIRRNGGQLYMRPKVFQVLLYLLEHRDRIVSKEEFLEQVWSDVAVTEDVLFRCIAELRTALGDDRRHPTFIRTYAKLGYQWIGEVSEIPREELPVAMVPPVAAAPVRRLSLWSRLVWAGALVLGVVVSLAVMARSPHPPTGSGEVAWWRMEDAGGGTVRDLMGNHGAAVGNAAAIDGAAGKALQFHGASSYVKGRDLREALPAGSSPRTLAAWIRTGTTGGDETNIFRYGDLGSYAYSRAFHMFLGDSGQIAFGYGSHDGLVRGGPGLADNRWHFVVGMYDGPRVKTARVLIDGSQLLERQLAGVPETPSQAEWMIGGSGGFAGSGTGYRGAIDEVRIFPRALRIVEAQALYRCSSRQSDVVLPDGSPGYFLPVHSSDAAAPFLDIGERGAERVSATVRHLGKDFGGVQFARSDGVCGLSSLRGAPVGQDLYMSMDLLTPAGKPDQVTAAGPYFRSRAAAPGDGIIGPVSAGYWVQLNSNGMVKIRRLNPHEVVAFTVPPRDFDAGVFHRLELSVRGTRLKVALDGELLKFDEAGKQTVAVSVPPLWEGPPPTGQNSGTAGILFGAWPRAQIGGQEARNIRLRGPAEQALD